MDWELPVIALRTQVVLPRTLENVDVGRPKSKRALEEAQAGDNRVLLVVQRDSRVDDPGENELYDVGTLALVKQVIRLPNDTLQVLVEGRDRARIDQYLPGSSLRARVSTIAEVPADKQDDEVTALMEQVKAAFSEYATQNKNLRLDSFHLENLRSMKEPGSLADVVAKYATWEVADKQAALEEPSALKRLELVFGFLTRDLEWYETEKQISARVKQQMDSNQREYFLREQMKAIQKELGSDEGSETDELRKKIEEKNMPEHALERALKELDRLEKMAGGSPEATVVRTYLDTLIDLPWSEADEERLEIKHSQEVLDEDHYALEEPKERIIEFLAVRQLTRDLEESDYKAPILCLVGPPGVGKTSLGKSIARSLNRKFVRMSLGGVRDEAEIRGHRRTYIGSMPGNIIQAIRKAKARDCVMMLDEIDKMGRGIQGDPSAAMLEVLDPAQNNAFRDNYLGVPFDLSEVLFVATANNMQQIPDALLDRMEAIEFSSYIEQEKLEIAKRYLLPRQLHENGLAPKQVTFTDGATIAQASPPSMKLPIALAMDWPRRVPGAQPALDFTQAHDWRFEPLDDTAFPAVQLARDVATRRGTFPAVYNAANEEAAAAFLAGRIRFPQIVDTVAEVLAGADQFAGVPSSVDDILAVEKEARARANAIVDKL